VGATTILVIIGIAAILGLFVVANELIERIGRSDDGRRRRPAAPPPPRTDDRDLQVRSTDSLRQELQTLRRRRAELLDEQPTVGAASGAAGWLDSYTYDYRQELQADYRAATGVEDLTQRIQAVERELADRRA
jgi:hypothetical protein